MPSLEPNTDLLADKGHKHFHVWNSEQVKPISKQHQQQQQHEKKKNNNSAATLGREVHRLKRADWIQELWILKEEHEQQQEEEDH